PGEKALVAVARLLQRGASVLFIDEATSTLPPADSRRLIESLGRTAEEEGATSIMGSHKLSEILDATERVVVLVDGKIAADALAKDLDREQLASMVVASESHARRERAAAAEPGRELLRLEAACGGRAGPVD